MNKIKRCNILKRSILMGCWGLLGMTSVNAQTANSVSYDPASSVVVNCSARTIKKDGTINGSWMGSYCGAVFYFRNSTGLETTRFVACALSSSPSTAAKCSARRSYAELKIPAGYAAAATSIPSMPDQWPELGTWRGYTKPPVKGELSSISMTEGGQYLTSRTVQIEHEMVTFY